MSHPTIGATAPLPTTRVRVGELEFSVIDTALESSAGEPAASTVLLLHGFPDRASMWRHQIAALRAAGHRVVAPDLRGFGDSDRPADVAAYDIQLLVGDVLGILGALGVDRFRLAAHDWGALLGWVLASVAPDRVERFAALSVGHPRAFAGAGFQQKQLSWYMLWWLSQAAEEQVPLDDWKWYRDWAYDGAQRSEDNDLDRQLTDLSRPGALAAGFNWYRANMTPETFAASDRRSDLPNVACPVLGVWGDREMALTERQMTDSLHYVDGPWRYERIERVGHWLPAHAPERISALLVDFFA